MDKVPGEFHYSTTLQIATVYPIVGYLGTTTSGRRKKVRITDLKASCGGTARNMTIWGQGGAYKPISFLLPADSVTSLNWNNPYPLEAISSTAVNYGIVASANGAGVKIVVSGFLEHLD